MAQSFTATEAGALAKTAAGARRHVLVTGAAGRIGSYFAEHGRDKYALRLMVRGDEDGIDRIRPYGEVVEADLGDLGRLKEVCAGVDTVVHLAGDPAPTTSSRRPRRRASGA
jgi:nucleoside-diphosphate-sugar epimerase